MFCLRATKITPLGHMPWVRSFLCRSAFVDPFYAAQPCKCSVNELRRCVLQGLKCEHTANCVMCEAAGERWDGVVGVESRGKRCFMFKGNDSDGMQGRERDTPACIFLLLPAKEAGTPGAHSFNKYLWRAGFVLVPVPGTLITQILPRAGRVLAANRIQIK